MSEINADLLREHAERLIETARGDEVTRMIFPEHVANEALDRCFDAMAADGLTPLEIVRLALGAGVHESLGSPDPTAEAVKWAQLPVPDYGADTESPPEPGAAHTAYAERIEALMPDSPDAEATRAGAIAMRNFPTASEAVHRAPRGRGQSRSEAPARVLGKTLRRNR